MAQAPPPARHGSAPVASLSTIDRRSFVPSPETRAWLYSLPLPPGCTSQPIPQTPEDWALVEQYRLLVHGLTVLGEYERERRRRELAGEDPFAREWDPRTCDNPRVIAAVESLFKDVFPSSPPLDLDPPPRHPVSTSSAVQEDAQQTREANAAYLGALNAVQAALGGSSAGVLRSRGVSPSASATSSKSSASSSAVAGSARIPSSTTSLDYGSSSTTGGGASFRLDPTTGDMIASLPLSLSDLASLPHHLAGHPFSAASSGLGAGAYPGAPLDPSQIPADGILADHLALDLSGPASLPSLMGAIAELEQCVARLSLEASEARNLQKSLRREMAKRSTGAAGGMGQALTPGGTAGSARAAAKKKKKKKAKKRAAAEAAAAVAAAATADVEALAHDLQQTGLQEERLEEDEMVEQSPQGAAEDGQVAPPQARAAMTMTRDQELVSGLSGRADDCCSECGESHSHAALAISPSPASSPRAGAPADTALGAGEAVGGLGVSAWEDGELMKALQSVSQLDRRADEYRERLRILKEQIHHHAALADSLAAGSGANGHGHPGLGADHGRVIEGLWPVGVEGDIYEIDEEEEEEEEYEE